MALKIAEATNDLESEARCYTNLGNVYNNLGQYQRALKKGLKIAERINDKTNEATCYINLGVTYHNLRQYQQAIEYYEKTLKTAKKSGDEMNNLQILLSAYS
jgi:tetratricopeptide (TPR) repeat protein